VRQGFVRIVGCSWALVCAGLAATGVPLRATGDGLDAVPARLRLMVTTSMALPAEVRETAVREVQQIWRREGITIESADAGAAPAPTPAMRVLIVSAAGGIAGRDAHHWPVAELLEDGHGQPIAIASVAAARRVLDAARLADAPARLVNRRLGIVLGRAVAHEVGHHLLNTAGHATHGLMRARIDARDFADLRAGGFDLDDDAAQWARARLTRPPADVLRLARFVHRP